VALITSDDGVHTSDLYDTTLMKYYSCSARSQQITAEYRREMFDHNGFHREIYDTFIT